MSTEGRSGPLNVTKNHFLIHWEMASKGSPWGRHLLAGYYYNPGNGWWGSLNPCKNVQSVKIQKHEECRTNSPWHLCDTHMKEMIDQVWSQISGLCMGKEKDHSLI